MVSIAYNCHELPSKELAGKLGMLEDDCTVDSQRK
jgi:hypothetical protein